MSTIRIRIIVLLLLCPLLAASGIPRAEPIGFSAIEKNPPVKARLLLLDPDFSNSLTAAIYLQIEPDWHLYWIYPGDSGLPPEVRWELPEGFQAGELIFPVPQKFISSGQVTYGFKKELLLLCEIRTPAGFRPEPEDPLTIRAQVDWMACRGSCLLGSSDIALSLPFSSRAERETAEAIQGRFRSSYPRPSGELDIAVQDIFIEKSGEETTVYISLSGKEVAVITDFYPFPVDGFVLDQSKTGFSKDKIQLALHPTSKSSVLSEISGLLLIESSAYEISIPMPLQQ